MSPVIQNLNQKLASNLSSLLKCTAIRKLSSNAVTDVMNLKKETEGEKVKKEYLKVFSNLQRQNSRVLYKNKPSKPNKRGIFVRNLPESITEEKLSKHFSKFGSLNFIHVYKNSQNKPLGFALIIFKQIEAAENCLENSNFSEIDGNEIRVMCSSQNSRSTFKDKKIKVYNLNKLVDNRTLFMIFSIFGRIETSKIIRNTQNESRGSAYLVFEDEKSAIMAIEKTNGVKVCGETLKVERFIEDNFTKVHVRNFTSSDFPDEKAFREYFEQFGEVSGVLFHFNEKGVSRGYACVDFKNHEDALRVTKMKSIKGKNTILAEKSKSPGERFNEIMNKNWRKLIVTNIPPSVNNNELRMKFAEFGKLNVWNIKPEKTDGSARSGMVFFENFENAKIAKRILNGSIWKGYNIHVRFNKQKKV